MSRVSVGSYQERIAAAFGVSVDVLGRTPEHQSDAQLIRPWACASLVVGSSMPNKGGAWSFCPAGELAKRSQGTLDRVTFSIELDEQEYSFAGK